MSEELEALERLHKHSNYMCIYDFDEDDDYNTIKSAFERKDQLETENADLKARNEKLEKVWGLVTEKKVNVRNFIILKNWILGRGFEDFTYHLYTKYFIIYDCGSLLLTKTEFDLLKEMIK